MKPAVNTQIRDKMEGLKAEKGKVRGNGKSKSTAKPVGLLSNLPLHRKLDDGYYIVSSSDGGAPLRYCSSIEILAKTRDKNGGSWGLLVEVIDSDGKAHRLAIPQSWLAGDGSEVRAALMDLGLFISHTPKGRSAFMEFLSLAHVVGRAIAVPKVGWSGITFVLPDLAIQNGTAKEIVIYQGADALDHVYGRQGTLQDWQDAVACYGPGNNRLIFAISAAFVGPLLSLLGEEGGGINFRGSSSIGKTTLLASAASVWGDSSFVRQWRATTNALEGICLQHNETLLCLDELAQLDEREAMNVAYMIANGMGKARAGRSGQLRAAARWLTLFLSTGEISLSDLAGRDSRGTKRSAAGQEVRVLDMEADAWKGMGVFEELHDAPSPEALSRKIKEGASKAYGTAGPIFVERLCILRDNHLGFAAREIARFVKERVPIKADGQVARGARRFALVAAAGELAIRLGVLPWLMGDARAAAEIAFEQWLNGRGGTGSAEDREAITKVRAFLEMHGSSRFEAMEPVDTEPRTFNRVGFWREGEAGREFLVTSEAWRAEVCAGMDANRVAKVLATHGLLKKDTAGRNSITVTLPGLGKARCYVISSHIFDAVAEA
jgi:putative DNA primase/helicase